MNKAPAFATRVLLAIAAMVVIAPPSWAQPGAPTAAATDTTPSPGPFAPVTVRGGGFGAAGQFVISGELELSIVKVNDGNTTFTVQPALDYFIVPNISVGGVVGLRVTTGDPTDTTVSLGGRAGYNLIVDDRITFWPQVGLFVANRSAGSQSDTSTALGLFAPFLFHAAPHLFVGLGPFCDFGLSGGGGEVFGIHSVVGGWL